MPATEIPGRSQRVDDFVSRPKRAVWTLSVPIMVGMAVQTLYSFVDMVYIGWLGGEALAALTFNMPLVFFSIGLTFGLGTGVTAVISQFMGAGDKRGADNTAEHALLMGIVLGVVIPSVGLLYKRQLFQLLGASPPVLALALDYFRIIAMGFVFMILNVQFRSIMTGEGDTRTPIVFQIIGTVLNLVLDPLLIFTAGMGIAGAAMATIISQAVVLCCFLYHFFVRRGGYLDLHPAAFSFSGRIIARVLRIGVPASASMVIMSSGSMFFNRIVSTFGNEAVAALGVGERVNSIFFLPMMALASSMVTLSGMFMGAGRNDLIRIILSYVIIRGQIFALVLGGLFFAFAPWIFAIFTRDPVIIETAVGFIRIMVFAYPFTAVGIISGRVFQGIGEGMPGLLLTSMRVILVSGLLAFVFVYVLGLGVSSVWVAMLVASITTSALAYLWISYRLRQLPAPTASVEAVAGCSTPPRF